MSAKPILFVFLMSVSYGVIAQDWKTLGADELFNLAREEAFSGDRQQAREKLRYILRSVPEYDDVRILLARTYAWDGERDTARAELQRVLKVTPKNKDAINALIDVEMWDEQHQAALEVAKVGLRHYPTFSDFLYKKASIFHALEQHDAAMATINQLLDISPTDKRALELRRSIKTEQLRYDLGVRAGLEVFNETFNPAFYGAVQLARNNDWGNSTLRLNYANRFQTSGLQGEVDLYPKIAGTVYGYLNYGYSESILFPQHRFGAEVYSGFLQSFEASLGLRHLMFSRNVTIYTGSLAWYHKSMWWSFRPFVTLDKQTGTLFSGTFKVRRYFGNPNNYLELNGGLGFSPDIRTIQTSNGLSEDEIFALRAQRLGAGIKHQLHYNWLLAANLDITRQELAFDLGNYLIISRIVSTLTYRF